MPSRGVSRACLAGAGIVLLVLALFLCVDNPTVQVSASDLGDRGPAGEVVCTIAPWDAGLHGHRDGPGGEHSEAYSTEVAAECYSANTSRFGAAVGSGLLALVLLTVRLVSTLRAGRPRGWRAA